MHGCKPATKGLQNQVYLVARTKFLDGTYEIRYIILLGMFEGSSMNSVLFLLYLFSRAEKDLTQCSNTQALMDIFWPTGFASVDSQISSRVKFI